MSETRTVTKEEVLEALRVVKDPDLGRDIVSLGFVKDLTVCGPAVKFTVELTTPACPVKDLMKRQAHDAVAAIQGVEQVTVEMSAQVRGRPMDPQAMMPGVKNLIAVGSGKGGVGKSTVAVNLAVALAQAGARVGLLDADIYGPSAPILLGITERPDVGADRRLIPIDKYGVSVMSIGFLLDEGNPAILRGPMVTKFLQQFLFGVAWGELDYLVIDLPPGTGDVQLTITQAAPISGAVIVTTPQDLSLAVATKGLRMFEKVKVPILGIVENMSYFECPHCSGRTEIFTSGGGRRAAEEMGVPFLGAVPIDPAIVLGSDAGVPVMARDPDAPISRALRDVAGRIAANLSAQAIGGAGAGPKPFTWSWDDPDRAPNFGEPTTNPNPGVPAAFAEPSPDTLEVRWQDGHLSRYPVRDLRLACRCASCLDENTGRPLLDPISVSRDVRPVSVTSVGRYAIAFQWSDGHQTGIYAYDYLRSRCPCEACRAAAPARA